MTFKNILIWLIIAVAAIFILLALTVLNSDDRKNFPDSIVQTTHDYINEQTPVRQEIYYNGCQHLIASIETGNANFINRSFTQLTQEGWEVFWGEQGQVVVFREQSGLCPKDQNTYILGAYQGKVAIFAAPKDDKSQPIEITNIYLDDLYPEIRDQITDEGLTFTSKEELYSALENLE